MNSAVERLKTLCANEHFQTGLKVSVIVSGAGLLLVLLPKKAGAIEAYQELPKTGFDTEYLKTWVSPSSWSSYVRSGFKSSPQFRQVLVEGRSAVVPFMGGLILGAGVVGMTSLAFHDFARKAYELKFVRVAGVAIAHIDALRDEVVRGGIEQISLASALKKHDLLMPKDHLYRITNYYMNLPSQFLHIPTILEIEWEKF